MQYVSTGYLDNFFTILYIGDWFQQFPSSFQNSQFDLKIIGYIFQKILLTM